MTINDLTVFQRINWTHYGFQNISISEIFEIIRTGNLQIRGKRVGEYSLKQITEAIRSVPDSNRQNQLKEAYLPAVTFNGVWDGSCICQYSNYTVFDFDYISTAEESMQVKERLKTIPCVMAVFRTFKPHRLKAIILHDNIDPSKHQDMYNQLMSFFGLTLLDQSCIDLSRHHYLVCDEDIWISPNPLAYHYIPSIIQPKWNPVVSMPTITMPRTGKQKSAQSIINILNSSLHKNHPEYWMKGYRASSIFKCACMLCEYGVPMYMAEEYFLNGGWIAADFKEDEVTKQVRGAYKYKQNEYGSKNFY